MLWCTDSLVTPNSKTCASVIAGGTCVLTGSYVVQASDADLGKVDNTAQAVSTEVTTPVTDSTSTPVTQTRSLGIEKIVDKTGPVNVGDTLNYTITATNTGNTTQTNVVVTDSLVTPNSKTCASVIAGGTCVLTGSYVVKVTDATAGKVSNTAQAVSTEVTTPVTDSLDVPVKATGQLNDLTKTALDSSVKRGERVPFVIRALDVTVNPARLVDIMPPGFTYVAGSARANGVAVEPVIDGRRLTFDGLVPDKDADISLQLTLLATAAAATGENVNRAELVNPSTGEVLDTARAKVEILDEAVFDCSDIIGKVFDDKNRNGYQDEGEPGLPGVRLATVKGLLVTTDPNGRFSVACADIPDGDIGTNFIMKLDPRTLPTGYRVTTENPRKVRLTRGKVVKLNFGAAITRLVTLDLNAKVFEQGSDALKPKWQAGLGRLVDALGAEPSTLRINYAGEDRTRQGPHPCGDARDRETMEGCGRQLPPQYRKPDRLGGGRTMIALLATPRDRGPPHRTVPHDRCPHPSGDRRGGEERNCSRSASTGSMWRERPAPRTRTARRTSRSRPRTSR